MVSPKFLNTKNVLIVDAYNLLLRVLFSKNKGSTVISEPELIQECAEIFIKQIVICVKKYSCERVYVGFDNGGSIRKKSIFEAYKQNRPNSGTNYGQVSPFNNSNNDLFQSLKIATIRLCQLFNLTIFNEYGIEADDFIGIATKELTNIGKQVIILSNDSDFLQLVRIPSVICSIPYNQSNVSLDNFTEYFSKLPKSRGITISSYEYLFYKTIVGDATDNINGIKGIGFKTLNKLMKDQLPLENKAIYDLYINNNLDYIKLLSSRNSTKLEKLIHENIDLIERNYKLIELSDRTITANTVSLTLKKLMESHEAPDKKEVIKEFKQIFPLATNYTEFILNSFFSLRHIYTEVS